MLFKESLAFAQQKITDKQGGRQQPYKQVQRINDQPYQVFVNICQAQFSDDVSKHLAVLGAVMGAQPEPQERQQKRERIYCCLLYTSPSPRDGLLSRMPS